MLFALSDSEYNYHIEVFCPKCGSIDVVIEVLNGFFYFSSCNRCGYRVMKRHTIERVDF